MRRRLAASAAILALAVAAAPARAQSGVLVQGIVDGELWSTDTGSSLLTRNGGRPGGVAHLDLWAAAEPWRRVVLYGLAEAQGGAFARSGTSSRVDLDQVGARWSPSARTVVDLGKLAPIVGTFAARRFSTRNPLIGVPDGYPVQYPVGAELSGVVGRWDYRGGVVSLPTSHAGYVPDPSAYPRPAIGAGFTPAVGIRVGASATWGPYLGRDYSAVQLAGRRWTAYGERVLAADFALSEGYLELHAEYARSRYDVPSTAAPVQGTTYYGEAKYTFTPRLYVAARAERNRYPFIRATGGAAWVARVTDFHDAEIGAGYRVTAFTIVKASYRWDRWVVTPYNAGFVRPGGHALGVQVSQAFDATDWLDRR
ncbi:MAG: hypothetical protein KGN74_01985 [Gemmatimonadota bacterium]|nr:hypothetical protein [Gemmatimonadota bacterium]